MVPFTVTLALLVRYLNIFVSKCIDCQHAHLFYSTLRIEYSRNEWLKKCVIPNQICNGLLYETTVHVCNLYEQAVVQLIAYTVGRNEIVIYCQYLSLI